MKKAVVLLSGGLDSTTTLAIARSKGFACHAMTFRYGQRHAVEVAAAKRVAKAMKVKAHVVVEIDLRKWGGSALTGDIAVPKGRKIDRSIPVTYVPARNTIFLSFALAWAEVLGARDLFIGVNEVDYSGYPDCRPEYLGSFEKTANLATKAGAEGSRFRIHAPLIRMTKGQIVKAGVKHGVDFSMTSSCYDPRRGRPCRRCDSCVLRAKGFAEAGIRDPIA